MMVDQTISHYQILEKIGAGGMGQVFKARDCRLGRLVALKMLPAQLCDDAVEQQRFIREATAASALDHANICTVYEVDVAESGAMFIAMAFYGGETLREKIRQSPLLLRTSLDLGIQIAEGLSQAHRHGVIHRDVKPANIIVTSGGVAKIVDFGLARLVDQARLTESGATVGTLAYMAPEQLQGQDADQRSDIFAFGIVLYEMLTGRHPFKAKQGRATAYAIVHEEPILLAEYRPDAPALLQQVLDKALAKDPADRYQQAADLLADLKVIDLDRDGTAGASHRNKRRRKRVLRYGTPAVFVLAFLVGVLAMRDPEPSIDSVAVLPLINLSGDPDQEVFADQMTEALTTELAKISQLKVTSRTSGMQYKGVRKPAPEIAAELGVAALLEGSVVQDGGRVRVNAQLIDARTDRHLWADGFDRELRNVLALQVDIARAIAQAVRVELTPEDEARLDQERTVDLEVQRLYLLGRKYRDQETSGSRKKAIEYLRRTVALDSTYAPALAVLAKVLPRSEEKWHILDQARRLDPREPLVHSVMSDSLELALNWAGAEAVHRKALAIDPNSRWVHHEYSYMLRRVGRLDEALEHAWKAAELDPLSRLEANSLGSVYLLRREYDRAAEQYRKAIELAPEDPRSYKHLALVLAWMGQTEEALAVVEEDLADISETDYLFTKIMVHAIAGNRAEARALFDAHWEQTAARYEDGLAWVVPMREAQIYALLGDTERALAYLEERVARGGTLHSFYVKTNPTFDNLRSDPRFTAILQALHLAP